MKITKKQLIKLIKEEISNVRESNAYDAITSELPDIIASLPMETVIRIIMDEVDLEQEEETLLKNTIATMVTNMPELEMQNIYEALKSQAGE